MEGGVAVPFFGDELFRWVCRAGDWGAKIAYSEKEYGLLWEGARKLAERVGRGDGVKMVELEKAAWVCGRAGVGGRVDGEKAYVKEGEGGAEKTGGYAAGDKTKEAVEAKPVKRKGEAAAMAKPQAKKQKKASTESSADPQPKAEEESALRRSGRNR
jgi:hypothetical protein